MGFTNLDSFNRELRRASKRIEKEVFIVFVRFIGIEALTRIVLRTPVDTGRARGNWQLSLNSPEESVLERAGISIGAETGKLDELQLGDVIWLANNVPYIEALENGHSSQAPEGMVALTFAELEGAVQEAA